MAELDLQSHASTLCGDLSGGTKRKVCAAISMLGNPHLILMDEPTRYAKNSQNTFVRYDVSSLHILFLYYILCNKSKV